MTIKRAAIAALIIIMAMFVAPLQATITVPNVFSPFTTISSSQVNANFSAIATNALDKRGDTMTGTLTTQIVQPDANGTRDIALTGTRYRDAYLSGQLNSATVLTTSTITSGGNVLFTTDNANDIGASGANRPRDIYVGRNFIGKGEFNAGACSANAITINFATNGVVEKVDRSQNCTYTLTAPSGPGTVSVRLLHDGTTTAYTVAYSPVPKYPNGTVPTYCATANCVDLLFFYWDGATWYLFQQPNMS